MRTARSIALLTVCEALGKLGTLVIVVGVARTLPIEAFGVFAVALGAGALIATIPSWGFDTLVMQRGAAVPDELPGLLTDLLAIRTALIAVAFLASVVVLERLDALADNVVPVALLVLACLLETLADAFRSVAIALEAAGTVAVAQLVQRALAAALVLAVLVGRPSLLSVAIVYLAGAVAGVAAMAVGAARLGVRPRRSSLTVGGMLRMGRLSYSGGVHSLASMALFRLDAVLLAAMAGAAAAGQYAAAYRLLETVIFVSWTVARSVFPVMAATSGTDGVRRGAERGLVVLAAVFLPYMALLWTRGGDIMRLLYGAPFGRSTTVLVLLAPAPLLFGAAYLAAFALMAAGPTPQILVGSLGALIVNVAINMALIPYLGPVGAALATTVAYAAECALLYPAARQRIGRPALARPLLPALLASAAAGAVLLLPVPFFVAVGLAAPLYLAAWLGFAARFDPEQIRVVRGVWSAATLRRSTP